MNKLLESTPSTNATWSQWYPRGKRHKPPVRCLCPATLRFQKCKFHKFRTLPLIRKIWWHVPMDTSYLRLLCCVCGLWRQWSFKMFLFVWSAIHLILSRFRPIDGYSRSIHELEYREESAEILMNRWQTSIYFRSIYKFYYKSVTLWTRCGRKTNFLSFNDRKNNSTVIRGRLDCSGRFFVRAFQSPVYNHVYIIFCVHTSINKKDI